MGSWAARGTAIRHEENCREVGCDAWVLENNPLGMLLFLQVGVDHSPHLPWLCVLLSENIGALQGWLGSAKGVS